MLGVGLALARAVEQAQYQASHRVNKEMLEAVVGAREEFEEKLERCDVVEHELQQEFPEDSTKEFDPAYHERRWERREQLFDELFSTPCVGQRKEVTNVENESCCKEEQKRTTQERPVKSRESWIPKFTSKPLDFFYRTSNRKWRR